MTDFNQLVTTTQATLARVASDFTPAVFASSLAAEDMVLTDMILRAKLPITIFTLETGRLHKETLSVLDRIKETYDYDVVLYHPETAVVDAYVKQNGLNAFYDSVEMRKECCRIRKVEPLNRALAGNKAWVTIEGKDGEHKLLALAVPRYTNLNFYEKDGKAVIRESLKAGKEIELAPTRGKSKQKAKGKDEEHELSM